MQFSHLNNKNGLSAKSSATYQIPKPDLRSYSGVINAYAKSGDGDRGATQAEMLLRELQKSYEESGDDSLRPDTQCFTGVIDAWAKCGTKKAPQHAQEIIDWMHQLVQTGQNQNVSPNIFSYNSLMQAWSFSTEQPRGMVRAEAIFNDVIMKNVGKRTRPDSVGISFAIIVNGWAKIGNIDKIDTTILNLIDHCQNHTTRPY